MRGRRLTTGAYLTGRLEVSERTVYRDIADLQRQGVPLEGEAGVGYRLGAGFELPPLMFSQDEAKALVAAVRLAQAWLDPELARESETALGKILSVLPTSTRNAAESLAIFAPFINLGAQNRKTLETLQTTREAVHARRKLQICYCDGANAASVRKVRPLGNFFWGNVWTLAAWCELRQDFRSFRMDRIAALEVLDESFPNDSDKSLAQLLRRVGANL